MATNFSPCKGSYVLNQFPSNVMFGMNGFHISASGAIQGHHGSLVILWSANAFDLEKFKDLLFGNSLSSLFHRTWLQPRNRPNKMLSYNDG